MNGRTMIESLGLSEEVIAEVGRIDEMLGDACDHFEPSWQSKYYFALVMIADLRLRLVQLERRYNNMTEG